MRAYMIKISNIRIHTWDRCCAYESAVRFFFAGDDPVNISLTIKSGHVGSASQAETLDAQPVSEIGG
jgi:hypothetical protein